VRALSSYDIAKLIAKMIPFEPVERVLDELTRSKEIFREMNPSEIKVGKLDEIEPYEEARGIFVDGSNVVSERRGAGIAIFSVASLLFSIRGSDLTFESKYLLTPDLCFLFLVPRFYVGTRANTIMRGLENIVAAYMAEKNENIDFVMMDGSFASVLLSPKWGIQHLYSDFYLVLRESIGDKSVDIDEKVIDTCEKISIATMEALNDIFKENDPKAIARRFIEKYVESIAKIYDSVLDSCDIPDSVRIPLMNFVTMFFETNFSMMALKRLMELAGKKDIFLMWLNKEPESRTLTKKSPNKVFRMFTDAMVLDFSLENGEYLLNTSPPEITNPRIYVKAGEKLDTSVTHAVVPEIAESVYRFGKYGLIYSKYVDFVIQYSYSRNMIDVDNETADHMALRIIRTLRDISPLGYPIPMIQAHSTTILRYSLADIVADSFIRLLEKSEKMFLIKKLIGKTGRKLAGV